MSFSGTKGWNTKPKPGVMLNHLHPLSRGLVGYWLFNEGAGSLVNDISGYGNHGTLKNMSPNAQNSGWGGSQFGSGLNFNGSNDYVYCGSDQYSSYNTGTISAFIKRTNIGVTDDIWSYSCLASTDKYLRFRISSNNRLAAVFRRTAGSQIIDTVATINSDKWYHVGVTQDGTKYTLYINGIEQELTGGYTNNSLWFNDLDSALYESNIGRWIRSTGSDYYDGSVGPLCIYTRALSAEEMWQQAHDPFCNLLQVPIQRYSVAAPPVGAIMNQFQMNNLGADLYDGAIIT